MRSNKDIKLKNIKRMKNIKLMKTRWIIVAICSLVAASATSVMGATSGNLGLSGSVPVILELSVNAAAGAITLTPSSNVSSVSIGTVVEKCNDADGYTVTLSSVNGVANVANSGVLVGQNASETLAYSLSYGGTGVSFTAGLATVTDVLAKSSADGDAKTVLITYDGTSSNLATDTYTDDLTFTIAAK